MSHTRILIHSVWSAYDGMKLLTADKHGPVCDHIRVYCRKKNIDLLNVNGTEDHLHALLSLASDQNIATVMNLIKGESSYWANRNLNFPRKFSWDSDYVAVSVSETHLDKVMQYIDWQEAVHQRMSYDEELRLFFSRYPFHRAGEPKRFA